MWLLLTALAALMSTVLWRLNRPGDRYKFGFLALVYWGATLMWLVDHVVAYVEEGGPFLETNRDSTWLGLSVLALGVLIWLVRLAVSDPKRFSRTLFRRG